MKVLYNTDATANGSIHVCLAEKVFVKLEKARGILLDKEKRSKYDFWRLGGFKNVISFEKWFDMQNRMHSVSMKIAIN